MSNNSLTLKYIFSTLENKSVNQQWNYHSMTHIIPCNIWYTCNLGSYVTCIINRYYTLPYGIYNIPVINPDMKEPLLVLVITDMFMIFYTQLLCLLKCKYLCMIYCDILTNEIYRYIELLWTEVCHSDLIWK